MGLLDTITGGHNSAASDALDHAYQDFAQVGVPSIDQLTLPELQKYVQAGLISPAQAQAVLQKSNAYDSVTTDPKAKEAEMTALNQLQDVASSKGMDATEQAKLGQTQDTLNQTLQGQRASVLDQMAARGIPTSLMGTAAQLGFAGQDAQQAHSDALQANADAQTRALAAMSQAGQLGGQMESQNFGEQSTKASAQNAIDQWNAANQTNVNLANQQAQQQTNIANQANAQNTSNANVATSNARTQYNAGLPQTQYQDKLQKAAGEAGVDTSQANNQTAQGQQAAGLLGAGLGAIGTVAGAAFGGPAGAAAGNTAANAVTGNKNDVGAFSGALAHGGQIPGQPKVQGDSPLNDTVPARLSPGEIVIPRSHAGSPNLAAEFVRHLHKAPAPKVHPDDVKHVLHALTAMRGGF